MDEEFLELPEAPEGEDVVWDYASMGLTLRSHPMALLRKKLDKYKLKTSEELRGIPDGRTVRTAGIVTHRQQPETATALPTRFTFCGDVSNRNVPINCLYPPSASKISASSFSVLLPVSREIVCLNPICSKSV